MINKIIYYAAYMIICMERKVKCDGWDWIRGNTIHWHDWPYLTPQPSHVRPIHCSYQADCPQHCCLATVTCSLKHVKNNLWNKLALLGGCCLCPWRWTVAAAVLEWIIFNHWSTQPGWDNRVFGYIELWWTDLTWDWSIATLAQQHHKNWFWNN